MRYYENVLEMIGGTPLVKLRSLSRGGVEVFMKLEFQNPGGSVKDRPALAMVEAAERAGLLKPGGTILEATSGNTGIGLSLVGAVKGYRVVIVMPENMSLERQKIMRAYGAELVLTPKERGMQGAIEKARSLESENPGIFKADQFENPNNPRAHEEHTAVELLEQMDGRIDYLVSGIGTGGTISGIGRALKRRGSEIHVIGVEPEDSPVLTGGEAGPHKLQGIGAGFVPGILDRRVIDEVVRVGSREAYEEARQIARREGLLVGISTGAGLAAVRRLVDSLEEGTTARIATISASGGERYLSTDLFD